VIDMSDREQSTDVADQARPVRSQMPRIVAGIVLLLIGVLWLLERTGALDLTVTTVLAIGTIVVGLALIVLAWDGPHTGTVVFGTVLALIATLTATAPLEGFQGGVGDRRVDVDQTADLEREYNLAMGDLTIDLRDMEDLSGETSIAASVGMGQLTIRVPEGVPVLVEARAGAGELQILGENADGLSVDQSFRSSGFDAARGRLVIEAEVFMGRVEVADG
jgi:predicted membrane protein